MEYSNMKVRKDATTVPEGYGCRDCGGDVCCNCCMKYGLQGMSQPPARTSLKSGKGLTPCLKQWEAFNDIMDAIEETALAVCYGERFLLWVLHHTLVDFLPPLLTEVLENEQLPVLLDDGLAMIDLTELCDNYGIDMAEVYDDTEI